MQAEDFLAGPRGRAVCLAYLGMWPGNWQLRPDPARSPLAALADATARAMYWQDPEDYDLDALPAAATTAIRRAAGELATRPDTAWWAEPAALQNQHVVGFEVDGELPQPPQLAGLRARIDGLVKCDDRAAAPRDRAGRVIDWRTLSAAWWSAPIVAHGVRSTRAVDPAARPVGLACVEDEMGWVRARSWPLAPTGTPRLYELRDPADWVRLCRDYPAEVTTAKRGDWWRATGRDGRWVIPDWPAVARDWDAVHLSVRGYLTSAGRVLDVDDGRATLLAGWDPDATFWLNDVLRFAGPATSWQRDEDGEWRRSGTDVDS